MKSQLVSAEQSVTGAFAPKSGGPRPRARRYGVNKYGLAGFAYAAIGVGEAFLFQTVPGDLGVASIDAAVIATLIGVPSALLAFRQGVISAAALSLFAAVNAIGCAFAAANGEPYFTAASVLTNVVFLAAFVRGGLLAFRTRRATRVA